jgi:hypothetical protein
MKKDKYIIKQGEAIMAITNSQINSEFSGIAITDTSGLVIGLDVQQLEVANVANLTIPGGTAGQVLSTDGNGVLSWVPATGAATQVASQATETFTATAQQTLFTLARVASGTVAGSINGVTAAATAFTVAGSTVTYVAAQNGGYPLKAGDRVTVSYLYGATSATELSGLADVAITTPAAGQVLTYDAATSAWVNVPGATSFGLVANGTSNVTVASNGPVTVGVAGTANVATFAAGGVTIPGNLSVTGANVSLGNVANVKILGGTAGQALVSLGGADIGFTNTTRLVTNVFMEGTLTLLAAYVSVPIIHNRVAYDPQALYNTTSGRFQPKVAGWYQIYASADCYTSGTAEGSITITHSIVGSIASAGSIGPVTVNATCVAYFNGTTDFAFAVVNTALAGSRTQNRYKTSFIATYLSI